MSSVNGAHPSEGFPLFVVSGGFWQNFIPGLFLKKGVFTVFVNTGHESEWCGIVI